MTFQEPDNHQVSTPQHQTITSNSSSCTTFTICNLISNTIHVYIDEFVYLISCYYYHTDTLQAGQMDTSSSPGRSRPLSHASHTCYVAPCMTLHRRRLSIAVYNSHLCTVPCVYMCNILKQLFCASQAYQASLASPTPCSTSSVSGTLDALGAIASQL